MKKLLTIFVLLPFFGEAQTTYYVSSAGSDANNGTSTATAWQTISKVNSATFVPGDQILFRKGDTFYGTITVNTSGTSGNPITLGAYGTGNNPIISGFVTLSSWTLVGGGIYKTPLAKSKLEVVEFNGSPKGMGETAWDTVRAVSGKSFTSNIAGSWVGAEAVMRKSRWMLDRNPITAQSGTTLTITSGSSSDSVPVNGYGYFIQNSLAACTSLGDWYSDGSYLYMYFGANSPSSYTIRASMQENLIYVNDNQQYITIQNLKFEGSNQSAIYLSASPYVTVDNCQFNEIGLIAIDGQWGAHNTTVTNCNMNNIYGAGVSFVNNCANAYIAHDTITNVNMIAGSGVHTNDSYDNVGDGIVFGSNNNSVAEYNILQHIGHSGIRFGGQNDTIRYNDVSDIGVTRFDAGGIYAWSGGADMTGTVIRNNIVHDNPSNHVGFLANEPFVGVEGIYVDGSPNVQILNNSVVNTESNGILLNSGTGAIVHDNKILNSGSAALSMNESVGTLRSVNITRNQLIGKGASVAYYNLPVNQQPVNNASIVFETSATSFPAIGIMDSNIIARPFDDSLIVNTTLGSDANWYGVQRTLASWQSFSGVDAHSSKSPKTVSSPDSVSFIYNATGTAATTSLPYRYMGMDGTFYNGSITLQPYTSSILIQDAATNPPPTMSISADQTITVSNTSVSAVGTAASGETITGYAWTVSSGTGTFGSPTSASTTVTGLSSGANVLRCTVTQTDGQTAYKEVTITVNFPAPTANAGTNQTITLPVSSATLSGSATVAPGQTGTYLWTKVSGSGTQTIVGNTTLTPTVSGMTTSGDYVFQLKVTQTDNQFATSTVTIHVNPSVTPQQPFVLFPVPIKVIQLH